MCQKNTLNQGNENMSDCVHVGSEIKKRPLSFIVRSRNANPVPNAEIKGYQIVVTLDFVEVLWQLKERRESMTFFRNGRVSASGSANGTGECCS